MMDDRPVRVLLVDDSEDIRFLLRILLEVGHDFEVWGEAVNGEEALKLVVADCPDAIVLDAMMPVMDGLTALPLLRQLCPATPVVIITAAATPEIRQEALALGACAVIDKCAATDQLRRTLAEVCAPAGVPCEFVG